MSVRHIVVAVDDSDASRYAFNWAVRNFASENKDSVKFHVVHGYDPVAPVSYPIGYPVASVQDQLIAHDRELARAAAIPYERQLKELQIPHETEIIRGNIRESICEKAELVEAEVLVVGSRNRNAVQRALLGSISDYCVHHCKQPVAVIHFKQDAKNAAST